MTARRLVLLVVAVGCVAAGGGVAANATSRALAARRDLVTELSTTMGRVRTIDRVAQQLRSERGQAVPAARLLDEVSATARSPREASLLAEARACVGGKACEDPVKPLELALEEAQAPIAARWVAVEAAERDTRTAFPLALALVVAGLVIAAFSGARARAAPPPVEDNRAL